MLHKEPTVTGWGVLSISGIKVDTIQNITPVLGAITKTDPFGPIQECRKFIFDGRDADSQYASSGSLKEAFWRTLIVDAHRKAQRGVYTVFSRAGPDIGRALWDMLDSIDSKDKDLKSISSAHLNLLTLLAMTLTGRRCFLTTAGYMGIGHRKISSGDEVFILQGGRCPVVLRRDQSRTAGAEEQNIKSPTFTFAGECFVHGIMDGEAARNFEEQATDVHIK